MPARVLIIDPDEDQLTKLRFALQQAGYSVEVARDGLEGFEKFKHSQPSLVITELMMDRLSGFELSSRIAASEGLQPPVIFYTGFYRDERARKDVVSKYGASGYFVKPFQLQALKRALEQHLGHLGLEEPTSANESPLQQESTRRFSSTVLGELQEKSELPTSLREGAIEETQETGGQLVNDSVPLSHGSDRQFAETMSIQEDAPQTAPPEPEPLVVEQSVAERVADSLPTLSRSPAPSPFYKLRSFQILAAMILIGVAFFLYRAPGSLLTQKTDVAVQQDSGSALPDSQVSPNSAGSQSVAPPGASTEPMKTDTSLAVSNPQPGVKDLTVNEARNASPSGNVEATPDIQGRPGADSGVAPSSGTNLLISDVTGEGGPPYLQKSKRPIISRDMIQTGIKPLVVRVVISRQGKVIEATSLNQNESNASLSRAALAAVQDWEFSPIRGKGERIWTRYFSFRFSNAQNQSF